ncbi:MAG TPA: YwiC-like family protein [Lachnospiraceae bacterium]|nr:YwiC-like family protein [Lachnospiraceae bacterium]
MVKEQNKRDRLVQSIKYSIIYTIIYGILVILAIYFAPEELLTAVGILGGGFVVINAFFIKYKKERLFVNGLISAVKCSFYV